MNIKISDADLNLTVIGESITITVDIPDESAREAVVLPVSEDSFDSVLSFFERHGEGR